MRVDPRVNSILAFTVQGILQDFFQNCTTKLLPSTFGRRLCSTLVAKTMILLTQNYMVKNVAPKIRPAPQPKTRPGPVYGFGVGVRVGMVRVRVFMVRHGLGLGLWLVLACIYYV